MSAAYVSARLCVRPPLNHQGEHAGSPLRRVCFTPRHSGACGARDGCVGSDIYVRRLCVRPPMCPPAFESPGRTRRFSPTKGVFYASSFRRMWGARWLCRVRHICLPPLCPPAFESPGRTRRFSPTKGVFYASSFRCQLLPRPEQDAPNKSRSSLGFDIHHSRLTRDDTPPSSRVGALARRIEGAPPSTGSGQAFDTNAPFSVAFDLRRLLRVKSIRWP